MPDADDLQDPLKPLDQILSSDPRHRGSLSALEKLHSSLSEIRLHAGAPLHVRQLFENAKNLSLHTWFVFRFHPVAKLMGYASLERALKERAAREDGVEVDAVRKTLHPLMSLEPSKTVGSRASGSRPFVDPPMCSCEMNRRFGRSNPAR